MGPIAKGRIMVGAEIGALILIRLTFLYFFVAAALIGTFNGRPATVWSTRSCDQLRTRPLESHKTLSEMLAPPQDREGKNEAGGAPYARRRERQYPRLGAS